MVWLFECSSKALWALNLFGYFVIQNWVFSLFLELKLFDRSLILKITIFGS